MIVISHRGNLNGPDPLLENKIETIESVINLGFDCEIDLWYIQDRFFLGHDSPETEVNFGWLIDLQNKLWVHCKNLDCIEKLTGTELNFFWHDKDLMTITSKGFYWSQPNVYLKNCISVELEYKEITNNLLGVCTDYPQKFIKKIG